MIKYDKWNELRKRISWTLLQIIVSKKPKGKLDKEFLKGYKLAMEKVEKTMNYLERKAKQERKSSSAPSSSAGGKG